MTTQINDKLLHRQIRYSITLFPALELFDPRSHGIQPREISSGCWRGYYAEYAIEDEQLLLTQVTVGLYPADAALATAGSGPKLFGVAPHRHRRPHLHSLPWVWVYDGLHEPVPLSGALVLADGLVPQFCARYEFLSPWMYRDVRELLFERGRLTDEFDRSPGMEEIRSRLAAQPLEQALMDRRADVWMTEYFSKPHDHY